MDEESEKKNKTKENGEIGLLNPKEAKDGKLVRSSITLGAAPEKAEAEED